MSAAWYHPLIRSGSVTPHTGQSLQEYCLVGGVVALIGIAALIGVNNGLLQSLTSVKDSLGSASTARTGQNNRAIAHAVNAWSITAGGSSSGTTGISGGSGSGAGASSGSSSGLIAVNSSSGLVNASAGSAGGGLTSASRANVLASVNTAQALLSQVDPANLPEVSGASSDIATLASTAANLVRVAKKLETLAQSNGGLDVNQLVYNARRLATAQYALAGEMIPGFGLNPYNEKAVDLGNSLLTQKPDDTAVKLLVNQSRDGFNSGNPSNFGRQSRIMLKDYTATFEPVREFIIQQGLQTQQAQTVLAKGGNIKNQNPVTTSADTTLQDAHAITLCQDANCTSAGP